MSEMHPIAANAFNANWDALKPKARAACEVIVAREYHAHTPPRRKRPPTPHYHTSASRREQQDKAKRDRRAVYLALAQIAPASKSEINKLVPSLSGYAVTAALQYLKVENKVTFSYEGSRVARWRIIPEQDLNAA